MKAAIFLDIENLVRNGGWGLRFDVVKDLVKAQGGDVIRANAYMAIDRDRESQEYDYRRRRMEYRDAVRRNGFHVVLKEVARYTNEEGEVHIKADADLDLAVDALLQSENLDYLLIGSGDGDFLRLVKALQGRGKRVDVLSFSNTHGELRREADYYFNGYQFPGLLPVAKDSETRRRGFLHRAFEEEGYGFLTIQKSLRFDDIRQDIFLHITSIRDPRGNPLTNRDFARLRSGQEVIEFDLVEENGRWTGRNAIALDDASLTGRPRRSEAPPEE